MGERTSRRELAIGWATAAGLVALNLLVGWGVTRALAEGASTALAAAAGNAFGLGFLAATGSALLAAFAGPRTRPLFPAMVVTSLLATGGSGFVAYRLVTNPVVGAPARFTDDERRPPTPVSRDGRTYLVDEALGFEILAPEGLTLVVDDAPAARVLATAPQVAETMAMWRWASGSGGNQVVIVASGATSSTDPAIQRRAFASTVDSGLRRLNEMHLEVLEDRRVSATERMVRAVSPSSGAVFVMRSIGYEHGGRFLVVVASGTTLATTELDEAVESLRAIH